MEPFKSLLEQEGFMPRRLCGIWSDTQIYTHVISDILVWLSYMWIPIVMAFVFMRTRRSFRVGRHLWWLVALYCIFITSCGWTHFFDALMFFNPAYNLLGAVKVITAMASVATAVSLLWLLPLVVETPLALLAQRRQVEQQFTWLKDILEASTDNVLTLRSGPSEMPPIPSQDIKVIEIDDISKLKLLRSTVRAMGRKHGFSSQRTNDLLTGIHEAAMNSLVHADEAVAICSGTNDMIHVRIQDKGKGISLDQLPVATLRQGYSSAGTGGYGWYFVLKSVDRVFLSTSESGTTVVIEMYKDPPPKPSFQYTGSDYEAYNRKAKSAQEAQ